MCKPCVEIMKPLTNLKLKSKNRHDDNWVSKGMTGISWRAQAYVRRISTKCKKAARNLLPKFANKPEKYFHHGVEASTCNNQSLRWLFYTFRRLRYCKKRFQRPVFLSLSSFIARVLIWHRNLGSWGMKVALYLFETQHRFHKKVKTDISVSSTQRAILHFMQSLAKGIENGKI